MRALIAIALVGSVSFAASVNEDCKSRCLNDCLEMADGNVVSDDCLMLFGMGPEGEGWYWKEEGCDSFCLVWEWDRIGEPNAADRSRTCQESCGLTCDNLCKPVSQRFHSSKNGACRFS